MCHLLQSQQWGYIENNNGIDWLGKINMQEGVIVEVLLDSGAIGLVMSLEFAKKQGFKLKKIKKPIYIRNMNSFFNKEGSIEYIVEVNIYYQKYRERMEINVIGG